MRRTLPYRAAAAGAPAGRATPLTARTLAVCEGLAFDGVIVRLAHGAQRRTGVRAGRALGRRTGCSRISTFWLTVWAHALRAAAGPRRPGEKGRPAAAYKIQLAGPLSLAAQAYLPGGERAMSDAWGEPATCWIRSWRVLERWVESPAGGPASPDRAAGRAI